MVQYLYGSEWRAPSLGSSVASWPISKIPAFVDCISTFGSTPWPVPKRCCLYWLPSSSVPGHFQPWLDHITVEISVACSKCYGNGIGFVPGSRKLNSWWFIKDFSTKNCEKHPIYIDPHVCLFVCLIDWLFVCLFDCLFVWLIDWLFGFMLLCFVLLCFVLLCVILFCFVVLCFVVFCCVLFRCVLFCCVLFCCVVFCLFVLLVLFVCFVCLFVCLSVWLSVCFLVVFFFPDPFHVPPIGCLCFSPCIFRQK